MSTLQERFAEVFPEPQRGLQADIMRLCNVSRPTVSAWFSNPEKVSTISRTHAELICGHFGLKVSPAWLAEGKEPKFHAFLSGAGHTPTSASATLTTEAPPTLQAALAVLAQAVMFADDLSRIQAAPLLERMAREPSQAVEIAARLLPLLAGVAPPPMETHQIVKKNQKHTARE